MRYVVYPVLLLSAAVVGCSQSDSTSTSGSAVEPVEQTASTVNQFCPIMGGKVAGDGGTADWDGKLVGFCCPGCEPKWEELSDDDKAEKLAAAAEKAKDGTAHSDHDHS